MPKLPAIIPARGGSKSIPRKNIIDLCGFPLLSYAIAACHLSRHISDIIVSTDDEEIASIARAYGAQTPFMRPPELACDSSSDRGFLSHFFSSVDTQEAALVRPTTPFRSPRFMDEVIEEYFSIKESVTGLRSLEISPQNPYKLYKLENSIARGFFKDFDGNPNYANLPRQAFPQAFVGNGHIDIVKNPTVVSGSTFGPRVHGIVCDKIIDIDSPADLKEARSNISLGEELFSFLTTHYKN